MFLGSNSCDAGQPLTSVSWSTGQPLTSVSWTAGQPLALRSEADTELELMASNLLSQLL